MKLELPPRRPKSPPQFAPPHCLSVKSAGAQPQSGLAVRVGPHTSQTPLTNIVTVS